jgi:hypothetical protein
VVPARRRQRHRRERHAHRGEQPARHLARHRALVRHGLDAAPRRPVWNRGERRRAPLRARQRGHALELHAPRRASRARDVRRALDAHGGVRDGHQAAGPRGAGDGPRHLGLVRLFTSAADVTAQNCERPIARRTRGCPSWSGISRRSPSTSSKRA